MTWQKELVKDKSLFEVFRSSLTGKANPVNTTIIVGWFAASFVALTANAMCQVPFASAGKLVDWTNSIAGDGLTYTSQILGFLVAGVALFASSVRKRLLDQLGLAQQGGRNRSYLKGIFVEFIRVFVFHLVCLFLCVVGKLSLGEQSAIRGFVEEVLAGQSQAKIALASFAAFVISNSIIAALVALKSFVWNLYQIIVVVLATKK